MLGFSMIQYLRSISLLLIFCYTAVPFWITQNCLQVDKCGADLGDGVQVHLTLSMRIRCFSSPIPRYRGCFVFAQGLVDRLSQGQKNFLVADRCY